MNSNKQTRKQAEAKVLRSRNARFGWPTQEEIPVDRALAIMSGGCRVNESDNKKRFGKGSKKLYYGHFMTGSSQRHLTPKRLRERSVIRDCDKEIDHAINSTDND